MAHAYSKIVVLRAACAGMKASAFAIVVVLSILAGHAPPLDAAEQRAPASSPRNAPAVAEAAPPEDIDSLFGLEAPIISQRNGATGASPEGRGISLHGFVQQETAYTYSSPGHWSRGVFRTQIAATGGSGNFKWKASARADIDPVIGHSDFYPSAVRNDQRDDFFIRETYLDTSFASWDLRLGRQHIVWGEVVGLFFADVVSARDLRDFILPEFEILRIPQWAARAEYFNGNAHLELLWIPFPSVDEIGKPGAQFYPLPANLFPGVSQTVSSEDNPATTLSNSNVGIRGSYLLSGWDISAFFYKSISAAPTFYRQIIDPATVEFTPKHDRIWQFGSTLTKDFGSIVGRAEAVYTANKGFESLSLSDPDGVVVQNTFDYILSADLIPMPDWRLNLQAYQRIFFDHDGTTGYDRFESGISIFLGGKIAPRWDAEFLVIQSLNRDDRMVRASVKWNFVTNASVTLGVDVFSGPPLGDFGRHDDSDRVYLESRFSF